MVFCLRGDQFVEIGRVGGEDLGHLIGPLLLVVHVGVIEIGPHLVLEEPGQFAIDESLVGVVTQALVAQQLDAPLHPAPAIGEILELDRDVVSHVPGLHQPNLDEMRFELGDPVGQLRHFEEFVLVLQVAGANPERVGNQAAKTAQRHGGEGQHRRRVFQRRHESQSKLLTVAVERILDL